MKIDEIGLVNWPKSWACVSEDIVYGREIVRIFKPFLSHLIESDLLDKTIKKHIDNLWLLGGHLIKVVNLYNKDRGKHPIFLLTECVDSFYGPRIRDLSEQQQNSFDSTCRKLYKYIVVNRKRYGL